MHHDGEFVAHITEAPIIEISDEIVHVRYRSGDFRQTRAMSIKVATKAGDRLARALARYAAGEQNIIVDD